MVFYKKIQRWVVKSNSEQPAAFDEWILTEQWTPLQFRAVWKNNVRGWKDEPFISICFVAVWFITVSNTANMIQSSVRHSRRTRGFQTTPACGATTQLGKNSVICFHSRNAKNGEIFTVFLTLNMYNCHHDNFGFFWLLLLKLFFIPSGPKLVLFGSAEQLLPCNMKDPEGWVWWNLIICTQFTIGLNPQCAKRRILCRKCFHESWVGFAWDFRKLGIFFLSLFIYFCTLPTVSFGVSLAPFQFDGEYFLYSQMIQVYSLFECKK